MDERNREFEAWYRANHARLTASLLVVSRDREATREAVDEAFTRAFARWGRVGHMDSPTGWVYRVALNIVRRRQRRAQIEARVLGRLVKVENTPAPAGELWLLVERLPPRQRTACVLRYVGDLTQAEIGDAMGIARSTVSSLLADGLSRLRNEMGGADDVVRRAR